MHVSIRIQVKIYDLLLLGYSSLEGFVSYCF